MGAGAAMNNFLGDLIAKQLPDGYHWELYEGFRFHVCHEDGEQFIEVPKGFVTDFASIPRGLWNIYPPAAGKHSKPAVVHDWLYKKGMLLTKSGGTRVVTRGEADAIFLEAMEVTGVSWLSRRIIYWGVRVGGWKAWGEHRKAEKQAA